MNDDKKKILYIIGGFAFGLIIIIASWTLLRSSEPGDGPEADAHRHIERLADEQRRAAAALERAEDGIDRSIERASEIERIASEAEESAGSIEERLDRIESRVHECEDITRRSEQRIAEYKRLLESY